MINNDIHDNQNELVELKELLFIDELDQIKELKSKVTHTFVNGRLVYENGKFNERNKGQRLKFNIST